MKPRNKTNDFDATHLRLQLCLPAPQVGLQGRFQSGALRACLAGSGRRLCNGILRCKT